MRKPLSAVVAHERFFATVNTDMLFKMMLELKGLSTLMALELTKVCAFVVTDHVPLQTVYICKGLVADAADLGGWRVQGKMLVKLGFLMKCLVTFGAHELEGFIGMDVSHVIS